MQRILLWAQKDDKELQRVSLCLCLCSIQRDEAVKPKPVPVLGLRLCFRPPLTNPGSRHAPRGRQEAAARLNHPDRLHMCFWISHKSVYHQTASRRSTENRKQTSIGGFISMHMSLNSFHSFQFLLLKLHHLSVVTQQQEAETNDQIYLQKSKFSTLHPAAHFSF